jgi:hypothetical protein
MISATSRVLVVLLLTSHQLLPAINSPCGALRDNKKGYSTVTCDNPIGDGWSGHNTQSGLERRGEGSGARIARLCFSAFSVRTSEGEQAPSCEFAVACGNVPEER